MNKFLLIVLKKYFKSFHLDIFWELSYPGEKKDFFFFNMVFTSPMYFLDTFWVSAHELCNP